MGLSEIWEKWEICESNMGNIGNMGNMGNMGIMGNMEIQEIWEIWEILESGAEIWEYRKYGNIDHHWTIVQVSELLVSKKVPGQTS